MSRASLFALGSLALSACSLPPPVEMVDVTQVWPLPDSRELDAQGFITAGSQGAHGVVFPRDVYDVTPTLTRTDEPEDIYANLVVTGARVDPCFAEGVPVDGEAECEPSVRLVLQPVLPPLDGSAGLEARDASIHAFYVLDDQREILDAIAALAVLRAEHGHDGRGPLGVHPLLGDDDGRAPVKDILLGLIGGERLVRVTSMEVHGAGEAWTFSGFAIDQVGSFTNPDEVEAQHVLSTGKGGAIAVNVDPDLPRSVDNYAVLLDDAAAEAVTLLERQAAFDATSRIQNPELHNAGTIDCVSCHLTAAARATAQSRDVLARTEGAYANPRYDLTVTTDFTDTQLVHNLGYRGQKLSLSGRLVNESAHSASLADALLHP